MLLFLDHHCHIHLQLKQLEDSNAIRSEERMYRSGLSQDDIVHY